MDVIKQLKNSAFFIRPIPEKTREAMAYIPFQNAGELYSPEQAICSGTLFPELDLPFEPGKLKGEMADD